MDQLRQYNSSKSEASNRLDEENEGREHLGGKQISYAVVAA